MKVVYIEFAGKGGMIHYGYQLCQAMAAAGADVTLITDKISYELESLPHNFKLERFIELWDPKPQGELSMAPWAVAWRKVRRFKRAFQYYGEWLRLIRHVGELDPDVVLLGDIRFPSDLFALMLLRRKSRLVADICHNVHPYAAGGKAGGLFDRSESRRFFYRRIYRLFDRVFVHFERNRKEFVETFDVPPDRVKTIVFGNWSVFHDLRNPAVDTKVLRKRLNLGADPIVLFFGTLSRYKGTDTLIEAFPRIHRETGARLVLAGFPFHDFDVAAHRELTRQHGVEQAVTWVPEYIPSEEIAAWMELADVVVYPYRDIYQSAALGVAQAFGAPIVASRLKAMQDVIDHERSGLLFEPGNSDDLAAAVIRLLKNKPFATQLGSESKKDAFTRFAWEGVAKEILTAVK